jgi:hypothetical protein
LLINIPLNVGGLQDIIVAKKDGFVHTRNRWIYSDNQREGL